MRVGLAVTMVADASAMVFGVDVAAPMQKQMPATKPIAIDTMFNAVDRSLMSSNVDFSRGGVQNDETKPTDAVPPSAGK